MKLSKEPVVSLPADAFGWAEGIAYSRDGGLLAVAEYTGNKVTILSSDGQILGHLSHSSISEPHDVAFSRDDVLGIANRGNSTVTLHDRIGSAAYSNAPRTILHRPDWVGTTAVSFDPSGERVVVVNHSRSVTCFERDGSIAWVMDGEACGFSMPDGLAFSHDGGLLAIANNMSHEVTLHPRTAGDGYRRIPAARLGGLRHPHSLAFTDDDRKLIVTNSGGPSIAVFGRQDGEWGARPMLDWPACPYATFLSAHYDAFLASGKTLACEGGAKGLALYGHYLAWSGPSLGVRAHEIIYESLKEEP